MPTPLSSLQLATLRTAPREWTVLEDRNAWGPTIGTLVARKLVERKKIGNATLWRLKPLTFREAVQRLVDQLPEGERALKTYYCAHELLEVRAMLESMPPEECCGHRSYPLAQPPYELSEAAAAEARTLLNAG